MRTRLPFWFAASGFTCLTLLTGPVDAAPLAYITNSHDNTVSVLDAATNTLTGKAIAVGARPIGIVVNPSGTRAYVANDDDRSLSVIDTGSATVIATIPGVANYGLAIDAAGTRVFATDGYYVNVIDTATNATLGNPIAIAAADATGCPSATGGIAVDPVRARIYVTAVDCHLDPYIYPGTVSVIDVASAKVIANVPVGLYPAGAAANPDGTRVYITNFMGMSVSVIDTTTNTVTGPPIDLQNRYPIGIALNPTGTRAYVANNGGDSVWVIDAKTNQTIGSPIAVGSQPLGIAVDSTGKRVYVSNEGSNSVSVIDALTNTAVGSPISVGASPVSLGNFIQRDNEIFADGLGDP